MLQNAQNKSNQDGQMFVKTMSERERRHAYRQAMQELATHLHGNVVFPGDPDYETARGVWNGVADRHPALTLWGSPSLVMANLPSSFQSVQI